MTQDVLTPKLCCPHLKENEMESKDGSAKQRDWLPYRRMDGKMGRYYLDTTTETPGLLTSGKTHLEILCRTDTGKWIIAHEICPECLRGCEDYEISQSDAVDWLIDDERDPRDLDLPADFIAEVLTEYDRLGTSPRN
jgi:hypothetical protein